MVEDCITQPHIDYGALERIQRIESEERKTLSVVLNGLAQRR